MVGASFKTYPNYGGFITDFMFVVMEDGCAGIIVNYEDAAGVVASLNEKVLNGNSLALTPESFDSFDENLLTAKNCGGLMLITVLVEGEIITEPLIYKTPEAYPPMTYYIEYDAKQAMKLPLDSTVIPFRIDKTKI